MNKELITIYGFGYVGKAVFNFFKDHYDIQIRDPQFNMDSETVPTNLAIVCVSTPMKEDGACDYSIVSDVLNTNKGKHKLFLLKSTVPPGVSKQLSQELGVRIVFSPEFIGEGNYIVQWWKGYPHPTDMKYHEFQIIGGESEDRREIISYLQKVLGPMVKYMQTDSTTAELVKYMNNCWGAMKVTFCNEFYEIAKAFKVDYNELRELLLLDGRIEKAHTVVFEDKRGFGGKCYVKDMNAIVRHSLQAGYKPELLEQVLKSNDRFKKLTSKGNCV